MHPLLTIYLVAQYVNVPQPPTSPVAPTAPTAASRRYFPHWESEKPDFDLEPIVGYKLGETKTIASAARSSGFEGGGQASYEGLRLVRGNPGLTLALGGGGALGFTKTTLANTDGIGTADSNVRFHRYWVDGGFELYYKALKLESSLSRGVLRYQIADAPAVQDVSGHGDLGLRVFRWLDLHGALSYRHVFAEAFADPATVELESLPYAHLKIDAANVDIDAGPAIAYVQESELSEVAAEGWLRSYFFRVKAAKVKGYDFHTRLRYVAASSNDELGRYATTRLSGDDFHEAPRLAAPEDTLSMSFAITADYGVMTAGWWFNWTIFDYSERGDRKSHTNRESGVSAFFGYDL